MGRAAQGVRGIKLKAGEAVAGMAVPRREGGELVLVTERGWAKRIPLEELQPQGRGGLGTVLLSPAKDTGDVAAAREVHPGEDLMAVTGGGRAVRLKVEAIAKAVRTGAPEKVVALTGGERVAEVTYVAERDRPEAAVGDEPAEETIEETPGPVDELDLFA
jgi:DNA gyrase subunit A